MKKIGFLSFGHWAPSSQSQTRSETGVALPNEYEPADFYAVLRHHPLMSRMVVFAGVGSNNDETAARARHWTKTRETKLEGYAEQKLTLAVSDNVGVEESRKYFSYKWLIAFGALGGRRRC
jgi:hypothetical protein